MLAYLLLIGAFCLLLAVGGVVTDMLCDTFPRLDELVCGREEFEK